jgi:hypothetical protein
VSEDEHEREQPERDEPTVLPERVAISILAQTAKAEERDEQDESRDST